MQDRCGVKWIPFNSCFNSNSVVKELASGKLKINKPILSEDQVNILNEKILEAYTNNIKINLFIFKRENILKLVGYVNSINVQNKYFNFNNNRIYFNQVLKITTF